MLDIDKMLEQTKDAPKATPDILLNIDEVLEEEK